MPFFVIFRSVRNKLLFTVFLDHPVSYFCSNILSRNLVWKHSMWTLCAGGLAFIFSVKKFRSLEIVLKNFVP